MSNEYCFEPLDPLEISFSKDKCNVSGTPRLAKEMKLPHTKENTKEHTHEHTKENTHGTTDRDNIYVRPFELSGKPSLMEWDMQVPLLRAGRWMTDKPTRKMEMSSPKHRLVATAQPLRTFGSTVKKQQLQTPASKRGQPSSVRRALDFTLRNNHDNEIDQLDDMLRRINIQLESSARCLQRFSSRPRK